MKDSSDNPFFKEAEPQLDDAFASPVASDMEGFRDTTAPVRAIGLESCYSVIHVPLIHPSLSRSVRIAAGRQRNAPVAIISILSDVIPYPANLVRSLTALAPHVAASFSVSLSHSSLLYELEMTKKLERRRLSNFSPKSLSTPGSNRGKSSRRKQSPLPKHQQSNSGEYFNMTISEGESSNGVSPSYFNYTGASGEKSGINPATESEIKSPNVSLQVTGIETPTSVAQPAGSRDVSSNKPDFSSTQLLALAVYG